MFSSLAVGESYRTTDELTEARAFTRHLAELLTAERGAMVEFLLALAEFDGRRLWEELGYGSLFDFLHRELGMSKGAAFYRYKAATLLQRFPAILEPLRDGRLCLSSLGEVAKVITEANEDAVLPRFFHRSSRDAKEIAASIAPQSAPRHREVITTVRADPARRIEASVESEPRPSGVNPPAAVECGGSVGTAAPMPESSASADVPLVLGRADGRRPPVSDHVEPLTATLRRVHMTVSDRWVQKLEALRVALSHSHPAGRAEEITEYALDVALAHVERKKGTARKPRTVRKHRPAAGERAPNGGQARADAQRGARSAPRGAAAARRSSARRPHVPAEVRRAVTARDEGRCQWKLHDGTTCGSNVRVQLDHIHPVALGGATTVENLRLLCARHNQLAARRFFGDGWMDQVAHTARRTSAEPRSAGLEARGAAGAASIAADAGTAASSRPGAG